MIAHPLVVAFAVAVSPFLSFGHDRFIQGTVVDPGGAPVENASVELLPGGSGSNSDAPIAKAHTDRKGKFRLTVNASERQYKILIKASGWLAMRLTVELRSKQVKDVGYVRLPVDCGHADVACDDFGVGTQ